jgi:hypothetical protein
MLLLASLTPAAEPIEAFGLQWTVPVASDWKVESDGAMPVLRMLVERPQREPRRPTQFALADTPDWKRVRVESEVKRIGGSLILVYAYRDATHFNYAHLSVDTAAKQPVHNGIFHVYGGERVRISPTTGPAALPSEADWYRVQLDYDASTGEAVVLVNGQKNPSLRAIDLSLGTGKVGIGSFFEKAMFRKVRITGTPAT